jgi:potassium-dependent mechanosensitive channel
MMSVPPVALLWRALLLTVALTTGAAAQIPKLDLAPTPPKQDVTTVVAPVDIVLATDRDERFAQEIMARSAELDARDELAAQLDDINAEVRTLLGAYRRDELEALPIPRLQSLENHWKFYDDRLSHWRSAVQTLTAKYSRDAAELEQRAAVWEATQSGANGKGSIAPALQDRIAVVLGELHQAASALSVPLTKAIDLGSRGNLVTLELDSGKQALADAIASYTRRLIMVDAAPLWAVRNDRAFGSVAANGQVGLRIEVDFLRDFTHAESRQLWMSALLWVAALPLFLWFVRRNRSTIEADPRAGTTDISLRRPFSTWLVIGAFGVPFLFPGAPIGLAQLALLVGLIPVIRLLPSEVFAVLRWWPYAVSVLYFFHRLRVLLLDFPLFYRLQLLVTAASVAILLVWLLRSAPDGPIAGVSGGARRLLRALAWIAIGAMLIAIGSNIVGNISLTEMLTTGVLESCFIGLAIYSAIAAVLALGRVLLNGSAKQLRFVDRHLMALRNGFRRILIIAAVVVWILVVANEFQIYRTAAEWATERLTQPIAIGVLNLTLGNLILFLIAVWAAFWVAKTIRVVLQDDVLPRMTLPPGVANSVSSVSYYALVLIGLLVSLAAAGFAISQLTIVFGALSVGVGLGLKNVVENFISGLILMFERPIRPGDIVEVAGATGTVRQIGMRATTLLTAEGAEVLVPNGTMLAANVINWTLHNTSRRIDIDVGVSYDADPATVQKLLTKVALAADGISSNPEPVVLFLRFNTSSLDFGIRAWTNQYSRWPTIKSDLGVNVHTALKEAGIEIPYPQQDVRLRSVTESVNLGLADHVASGNPAAAPRETIRYMDVPATPVANKDQTGGR